MRRLMNMIRKKPPALPASLVSPEWLRDNFNRVNLLNAAFAMPGSGRNPAAEHAARHIAGARFFDIERIADKASELPHMLPAPEDFAAALIALGFDENRPTVIYDDGNAAGACRCWWMLRVFGYDNSALLDGGLPAWEKSGLPATDAAAPARQGKFTPRFRADLVWNRRQVMDNLGQGDTILLDARAAPRFKGEQPEPRPGLHRGHIPGSLNLPYADLLDPQSKAFKTASEIQAALAQAGARQDEPMAATCGSGVSACVIAFALHLLGRNDIPVYDGSWAEWGGTAGLPVMQGPGQRLQTSQDENTPYR